MAIHSPMVRRPSCGVAVGDQGCGLLLGQLEDELPVTADEGEELAVGGESFAMEHLPGADSGRVEVAGREPV